MNFLWQQCSPFTEFPFMQKDLKEKSTFSPLVVVFVISRNRPFHPCFPIDCLGVILKSFIQVGVEMGKEGIDSFLWDVCGAAALLDWAGWTVRHLGISDK